MHKRNQIHTAQELLDSADDDLRSASDALVAVLYDEQEKSDAATLAENISTTVKWIGECEGKLASAKERLTKLAAEVASKAAAAPKEQA